MPAGALEAERRLVVLAVDHHLLVKRFDIGIAEIDLVAQGLVEISILIEDLEILDLRLVDYGPGHGWPPQQHRQGQQQQGNARVPNDPRLL
jgi:hypothetical protein